MSTTERIEPQAAVTCRAPEDGDDLDRELARRLNSLLAGVDESADYRQPIQPVMREIAYWTIATVALAAAALALL